MSRNKEASIELEESSGNVFADLGLDDADELFTRSRLGYHVYRILIDRKLKQRDIAALLSIKQPEVSHLMNGHFSRFTTDKLLEFLKRLDRKVTIRISPQKPGEPYQEIGVGLWIVFDMGQGRRPSKAVGSGLHRSVPAL
jgi:predicted XRE-type DNA-binding protein